MDRIYVYNVWCIRQMGGFGHDMLISCLECLILIRTESCSTFCLTFDSEFRVRSSPFRHESNPYFQPRFVFPAPAYFNSLIREGFKLKRITGYDPPEVDVPSDLQKGWWVSSTWLPWFCGPKNQKNIHNHTYPQFKVHSRMIVHELM